MPVGVCAPPSSAASTAGIPGSRLSRYALGRDDTRKVFAAVRSLLLALLCLASLVAAAHAVQPDEILSDAALESRARTLSRDLRCMVCQNQSIDDSDAPLARDLRLLVRERLTAGDNDNQVIDYLVSRYGEFVLLKPRIAWHTAILWGAPLILLALGVLILVGFARRRAAPAAASGAAALTPAEQARLDEIARRDS
jgi:cytochrome c-type biogenesis protein CcmH